MQLTRREALHRLTLLVGATVSAPALDAILSGVRAQPMGPEWIPRRVSTDQAELLGLIVDRIIPPTDTPGAREAGVPGFIDTLLDQWVDASERTRFLAGLAGIDEQSTQANGVGFAVATAEQQLALLHRLDAEAIQARADGADPLPFFATLKEWTLVGYYTSEVGATAELQWLAAPGRYQGDLPLREVGRTWA